MFVIRLSEVWDFHLKNSVPNEITNEKKRLVLKCYIQRNLETNERV